MSKIIQAVEQEQMKKKIPDFRPGDTIVVQVKVTEGERERLQAFEGVVIAKRNRGLNSSFIVRKISHGEGVERTFQTHSPVIASIKIKRRGAVRRAKLYYLRDLSGRKARIKEKIVKKQHLDENLLAEEEPIAEEEILAETPEESSTETQKTKTEETETKK